MSILKNRNHHHDISDDVEKIKKALRAASHDIKCKAGELLNDSYEDVKGYTSSIKDNVEDYTTEKPIKSLGIALLIGVAVGFLIRK